MERFTAKGALLTGVDLIRRRPSLFLLWAALLLALTLLFAVTYQELMAWVGGGVFSGRPGGSTLAYALAKAVLSLILMSVIWASAFRSILRPVGRRALGFGGEELAVFGAWLVIQIVVAVVSAVLLPMLLVSHFAALDARLIVTSTSAIGVLGLFWSAVAGVWAFEKLRVAPIRCWTIARGRFWLLAALVIGVAVLHRLADAAVHQLAVTLNHHVAQLDTLSPPALLRYLLAAVIEAFEIAFVAGIVASAYRTSQSDPQAASFASGSVAEPS